MLHAAVLWFSKCIFSPRGGRLRNVTLLKAERDGKRSWRLLGPDGVPIHAYEAFMASLLKRPLTTRTSYARNLAEFIDYLIEAGTQLSQDGSLPPTFDRLALSRILESYDFYLVEGGNSGNEIARRVHAVKPSPCVTRRSSAQMHAAVRAFLELSEKVRLQLAELERAGLQPARVDPLPLLSGLGEVRQVRPAERAALLSNSMLSGVISGGPRFIADRVLPTSVPDITYDESRAFPYDKVPVLISNFTTFRDKALYAFCAASGCRISEALQILWDDIDVKKGTVRLIDPKRRPRHPSYLALTPLERDALVWKGRQSEVSLLIEPFVGEFFAALEQYLKKEYIPHGRHQFVFQYSVEARDGLPYFLSAASSRNEVFRRAVRLSGLPPGLVSGPHSLRHMYGTYLLNYFPRPDGSYGLPMALVQHMMGHASLKSTAKYARHDQDLLEAELRFANRMVFKGDGTKSLNELRKEALQARLAAVEQALREEGETLVQSHHG